MKIQRSILQILFLPLTVFACHKKQVILKPELIILQNSDQIIPLQDSMVRPILYRNITELSHLSVKEVKQKFIAIVLPAVLIAKHVINEERKQIETLSSKESWSAADSSFYNDRKQLYKAGGIDDLLNRKITHPNSIVLAQAAVESGWGSARFFKEGNNLFGVWAYKSDEPRIAANEPEVYLRRYDNISQSITDYFVTIGRARPYRQFRKARAQSQDVGELLPHLKYYSERGKAYINQLKTIIRQNNLTQYDGYIIDKRYFF